MNGKETTVPSQSETCEIKQARAVMENEAYAIQLCAQRLDKDFQRALDILSSNEGKVVVTGIGKSGHLAKKMAATLCSTGTPSAFLHPTEAIHGDLGIHQAGDSVIYLSNSGTTPELIFLEPVLRSRDAKIVGILGNINSPLADKVDCILDSSVSIEADPLGIVPTASFMVSSALCDALASSLMKRKNFSENDYARTHPGGQLGRNLILQVKDVLHSKDKIACVNRNEKMRKVVSEMTKFPLGAACVMNNKNFEGIITEGDLRRALNESCELDLTTAEEIMSTNPKQISPNVSLGEALEIMEKGETQISILPVIDPDNSSLLGLLRLHDIFT
jgi:arabinose-5-phosphate isomerase